MKLKLDQVEKVVLGGMSIAFAFMGLAGALAFFH
jgi:hypothetical protein